MTFNIQDFIGETTAYDKKAAVELQRPKSWLKSVSAFANGDGGTLLFGLQEDNTLVGIEDVQHVSEKISELIKSRLDPIPVFRLAIQQIEGNLIYPHIVGKSVGLPAIWTLMAVYAGGQLCGIIGMLLFVPIVSVIYTLIKEDVNKKIKEKSCE